MWNLVFLFTGLIFIILLLVIFLSKPKIKTKENKMFLILSTLNFIGYVIEIVMQIFVRNGENDFIVGIELSKLYIIYIFLWFSIFSIYTFLISNSSGKISDYNYKTIKYTHITTMILGVIGIIIMPIKKYYFNGEMYTYGMSVNFLKMMLGIYIFIWIVRLLLNFNAVKEKKYYSIIVTILLLFANIVIQTINPAILIATFTMTYTCYIIFFTIENPDIKLAKDLAFSKEIVDRSRSKTLETLNNIEDKLEDSLNEMRKFGYKDVDYNDKEEVNHELKYIKNYCIHFVDDISGLIDVSKIDSGSIKIKEEEYETNKLFEDTKQILKYDSSKKIKVSIEIDDKIPGSLYGDKNVIKQMMLYIYDYLKDVSDKGILNIKIDSISVGNFCKLKFYFSLDNAKISNYVYDNTSISKLDVKDNNIKYMKIKKQEKLIGSKITIVNDNELLLAVRQRIIDPYVKVLEKKENIGIRVKYFDATDKRILVIDDNNVDVKELILLLKPYKIDIDISKSLDNMNDKLSSNKTYDMVLVDSSIDMQMEEYDVNLLRKFVGYNFKIIVMLSKGREKNKEKYLEQGFDDYMIKPIDKKSINEMLVKYLKK